MYFHIRRLLQTINGDEEMHMPLTKPNENVKVNDVLDLSMLICQYTLLCIETIHSWNSSLSHLLLFDTLAASLINCFTDNSNLNGHLLITMI